MPVRIDDVMKLLKSIAHMKGMKAAVTHSGRGALLAGASAFLGGLVAGPAGIAAVGGLLGWITSGDFKPVPQILMELPPSEQRKLCAEAMAVIKHLDWTDAAQLLALVLANPGVKEKVIEVLSSYLYRELKAQIKYQE
ncbi:CS012 protein, partial [Dryoscopus gambensis]|nr:CS012 protein [Dryoscopus gambensis]